MVKKEIKWPKPSLRTMWKISWRTVMLIVLGKGLRQWWDWVLRKKGSQHLINPKVPGLGKQSVVVPVAKVPSPKVLNDYGPVALTSLVMKVWVYCEEELTWLQNWSTPICIFTKSGGWGQHSNTVDFVTGHLEGKKNTHTCVLLISHQRSTVCSPIFLCRDYYNSLILTLVPYAGWLTS